MSITFSRQMARTSSRWTEIGLEFLSGELPEARFMTATRLAEKVPFLATLGTYIQRVHRRNSGG